MGIDLKKYVKGKFYSLGEVFDQRPPPREQIAIVKDGNYNKPVLAFESGRQAGVNNASLGILMREFGDDPDAWIGQWVALTAGEAKDQNGNPIDALIVRPAETTAKPTASSTSRKARRSSAEMDDEVPF
jgi:hypothetical protein